MYDNGSYDNVATLTSCIKQLMEACSSLADSSHHKVQLLWLEKNITLIHSAVDTGPSTGAPDICLLHQYEEQLWDLKTELGGVSSSILAMDVNDSDDLCVLLAIWCMSLGRL